MDNFRVFIGAASNFAAMFISILIGLWAAKVETQYGLEESFPWAVPLVVAVTGLVIAGILWKALIEFGVPRFFHRRLTPLPLLAIMTFAFYGVFAFSPDIPRPFFLAALTVIPVIPASQLAYRRLRREHDEENEYD